METLAVMVLISNLAAGQEPGSVATTSSDSCNDFFQKPWSVSTGLGSCRLMLVLALSPARWNTSVMGLWRRTGMLCRRSWWGCCEPAR